MSIFGISIAFSAGVLGVLQLLVVATRTGRTRASSGVSIAFGAGALLLGVLQLLVVATRTGRT